MAGMREDGSLIRLYPIPFRLLGKELKFKKWQFINIYIEKSRMDRRPESYKVYVDNLEILEEVNTKHDWKNRRYYLSKISLCTNIDSIKSKERKANQSLALFKPNKIIDFEILEAKQKDWTQSQKDSLSLAYQGDLFSTSNNETIKELRKLPYDFYVYFEDENHTKCKHKILDWEIGSLYWNVCYQADWKKKIEDKLKDLLFEKDIYFLMGNEHRFQHNWHIISLIYPPKQVQQTLDLF